MSEETRKRSLKEQQSEEAKARKIEKDEAKNKRSRDDDMPEEDSRPSKRTMVGELEVNHEADYSDYGNYVEELFDEKRENSYLPLNKNITKIDSNLSLKR